MRAVWPPPPSASYVDQQEIACRTHKLGSAGRVPLTLVGAPARGLPDGDTRCMRAVPDRRSAKTMGGLLRIRGGRGIDESGNGDSREGGKKGAAEKIGEMDPQVLEARWEEERAEALEEMGENDASRDLARVKMLEEMVLEFHRESGQTKTGELPTGRWLTYFAVYMTAKHPNIPVNDFNSSHLREFQHSMYPFLPPDPDLEAALPEHLGGIDKVADATDAEIANVAERLATSVQRDAMTLSAEAHNSTEWALASSEDGGVGMPRRRLLASAREPASLLGAIDAARNGTRIMLQPGTYCRAADGEPWAVPTLEGLAISGSSGADGASRVWGTWGFDEGSSGALHSLELAADTPPDDENSANATLAGSLLDVAGQWSISRCAIRASVLAAVSVLPGGEAVLDGCSVGGIGDLAGTAFTEMRSAALAQDLLLEQKIMEGLAAGEEAKVWFEKARDDPAMLERANDPDLHPLTLVREHETLTDKAESLLEEVQKAYEARMQKQRGLGTQEDMEAEALRGERGRDCFWADRVSRCRNSVEVYPAGRAVISNSTLSLAEVYTGAAIWVAAGGRAEASQCTLTTSGVAVGLSGDARVELFKCLVSDMELGAFSAAADAGKALLSVRSSRLGFPTSGNLWEGPARPGKLDFEDNTEVREEEFMATPADIDEDFRQWQEMHREMEETSRATLEAKLQEIDLTGEIPAPNAEPGRNILFASDDHISL
ncbi:hypothetical protein T484DRAFT_1930938 [Baffinella frigidus]|nr:hypothetical protein T484DRAFT_1930938 [Cryptophyta sp. CCMP2293]